MLVQHFSSGSMVYVPHMPLVPASLPPDPNTARRVPCPSALQHQHSGVHVLRLPGAPHAPGLPQPHPSVLRDNKPRHRDPTTSTQPSPATPTSTAPGMVR